MGTPGLPIELMQTAATTARILTQISQIAYDSAWEAGRSLPLPDLFDELLTSSIPQP